MSPRIDCQLTILGRLHERLAQWYEVSSTPGRITSMEGLRGLAVLLVFFVHFHALFGHYVPRDSVSFGTSRFFGIIGHSGVDLFFVISGYLIYGAVLEKRVRYMRFLRRRVQRIYPTFLSVFSFYLVLSLAFPDKSKIPEGLSAAFLYIAANVFLLPGILPIEPMMAVAWTLSYEFCFYLTIPIFVTITGIRHWRRARRALFLTACLGVFLACSLAVDVGHSRFALFLIGALVFEAAGSKTFRMALKPSGEVAAAAAFVAGLAATYLMTHQPEVALQVRGFNRVLVLCFSLFAFVFYSIGFDGFLRHTFGWTPIRWLGNMSYSYYLMHSLTLQGVALLLSKAVAPGYAPVLFWVMLPISFFVTLVTSTVLFLCVEKRFSLTPRKPAGRLTTAEYTGMHTLAQKAE